MNDIHGSYDIKRLDQYLDEVASQTDAHSLNTRIEAIEEAMDRQMMINESTNATLRMLIGRLHDLTDPPVITTTPPPNVVPIKQVVMVDDEEGPVLTEFVAWMYEIFLDNYKGIEYVTRHKLIGEYLAWKSAQKGY